MALLLFSYYTPTNCESPFRFSYRKNILFPLGAFTGKFNLNRKLGLESFRFDPIPRPSEPLSPAVDKTFLGVSHSYDLESLNFLAHESGI